MSDASRLEIGRIFRSLRLERGYTLADVAAATNLSSSFVSMVENETSDISFGRLLRLTEYYGISLVDLVVDEGQQATAHSRIVPRGQPLHAVSTDEGVGVFLLAHETHLTMVPNFVEYQSGSGCTEYASHPGEEFVHVLSGTIGLDLEGEDPMVLRRGDSVYYRADRRHAFSNKGKSPARMITAVSPSLL